MFDWKETLYSERRLVWLLQAFNYYCLMVIVCVCVIVMTMDELRTGIARLDMTLIDLRNRVNLPWIFLHVGHSIISRDVIFSFFEGKRKFRWRFYPNKFPDDLFLVVFSQNFLFIHPNLYKTFGKSVLMWYFNILTSASVSRNTDRLYSFPQIQREMLPFPPNDVLEFKQKNCVRTRFLL